MFGKRESKNKIKTEGGEAPAVQEELYGSNSMNGNSDMENESAGIEEDTYETDGDSPSEIPATMGLSRKRKKKNKKRRRIIAGVLVVVLLVVVVGGTFLGRMGPRNVIAETQVQSATAEKGNITTTVVGTGTLETEDAEDVVVPSGIKIEEVLVESGDTVKKGQTLATVNEASIASELLDVKERLDDVNDEIDDLSDDKDDEDTTEYLEYLVLKGEKAELKEAKATLEELLETQTITADRAGTIESVYAAEGEELTSTSSSSSSTSGTSSSSSDTSSVIASYSSLTTATVATKTDSSETVTVASSSSQGSDDSENVVSATKLGLTTTKDTTAKRGATSVNVTTTKLTDSSESTTASEEEDNTEGTMTTSIDECTISVTAPVTGNTPETTLGEATGFSGTISWSPSDSTFQAETVYTATITLTAEEGYIFASDISVAISSASEVSMTVSNDGQMLIITATFPTTEAASSESTTSTEDSTSSTTESSSSTTSSDSTDTTDTDTDTSSGTTGTIGSGSASSGISSGISSGSVSVSSGSSVSGSTTTDASTTTEYSAYEAVAFTIVDAKKAVISLNVDELDILSVEEGQSATVTMDAVEGEEFEGTITSVSTTASGSSSSTKYPVEITIDKTDDMMYGMSASVTINIDEATDAIVIPVDALQENGSTTYVYTEADDDGNPSGEVEVTTGLSDGSKVAILTGLAEGDTVYYISVSSDSDTTFSFDMSSGGGGNFDFSDAGSSGGSMPSGGNMPSGGDMPSGFSQ